MSAANIKNLDSSKYNNLKNRHLNPNLPKAPYRGIFVGSSNAGKTNLLCNLLLRDDFAYDKIYIICPNVNIQPKYLMLKDIFEKVDENVKKDTMKKVNEYNKKHKVEVDPESIDFDPIAEFMEDVPSDLLDRLDQEKMNLIVLDDLVLADKQQQKIIDSLFIRGRHSNASVLQLCQSFYRASRISRLQCNLFILLHSTNRSELTKLHKECGLNVNKNEFCDVIMKELEKPYSFVVGDLDSSVPWRKSDFTQPLF